MAEAQKATSSTGNGGNLTSKEMDREIERLKKDMAQISDHVSKLLSATGTHATRQARYQAERARRGLDDVLTEASEYGDEALDSAREVRDTLAEAIEDSVYQRPFTTLGMALAAGFVIGALWRR